MNVSLHFHELPQTPESAPRNAGLIVAWLTVVFLAVLLAAGAFLSVHHRRAAPEGAPLGDPRPEVQRFVEEAARGTKALPTDDLERLAATLSPQGRQALPHEVNYLLARRGVRRTFAFDDNGRLSEVVPPSWPACLIDEIVAAARAGTEYDLTAIAAHFREDAEKGDPCGGREFLGRLNARLSPLGKAARWDGRTLAITPSHP